MSMPVDSFGRLGCTKRPVISMWRLCACYAGFLQITNDMIDRARHKEDYHIERIFRTMNFQHKEGGVSKDDLITFLGVCGKHYRKEDIESLINRIDPWFVIIIFLILIC